MSLSIRNLNITASVAILCAVFWACSDAPKHAKDPAVEKIAATVSEDSLATTISDLVAFGTRWPYEKQVQTADYLRKRLAAYNSTATFREYEFWGVPWQNVVVTIPGKTKPEEMLVVCAHYDSDSEKKLSAAPGADDNGSGTAAVVEVARILSGHTFNKTIKFVLFSREEQGLSGSKAFVKSIDRSKEKIIAAIDMDMIANGSDSEDIDLFTRPEYRWLANEVDDLARVYGLGAKKNIRRGCY